MQAASNVLPNGGSTPPPFHPQPGIASSSRPTTPFVPSSSTPTLSSAAPTPALSHQTQPAPASQHSNPAAGQFGNYQSYNGGGPYMYPPNNYQYQQHMPRGPGGPASSNANGNGGVGAYQGGQPRYPDGYGQGFVPQPYYPYPQMGGPGPATMQNGYGQQMDYGQGYARPPYPAYPQTSSNDVNVNPAQPPTQSQSYASANVNGGGDGSNPGPADSGAYQQHPPPPTLPPPSDYPQSFQHPPPPFAPHGGGPGGQHPGQGYPVYYPPNHPYAYGSGVGYPAYPSYPGYDNSHQYQQHQQHQHPHQHQHQQYPQHQQHQQHQQHFPQQNQSHQQQQIQQPPIPPQPHQRASSSASLSSSRLNPAAGSFTFVPSGDKGGAGQVMMSDGTATGGSATTTSTATATATAEKTIKKTVPILFASLPPPPSSTKPANQSTIPNGHAQTTMPKKWAPPVIANGEKFKGMTIPNGDSTAKDINESAGTGLGLSMDGTTPAAQAAAAPSTVASTPQPAQSTPAMSTAPTTTATTPDPVRTPRAAPDEVEETDGEATILFSPQAGSSPSRSGGILKFIGSPVSGYSSPPMTAHVPMQSFGQVQAQEVVRSKKSSGKESVDAEPYRLAETRPSINVPGVGVFYARRLESGIPEKYRREVVPVAKEEVTKRQARKFGSKGAVAKIGVRGEKIPKRKTGKLVFGEIEDDLPAVEPPKQKHQATQKAKGVTPQESSTLAPSSADSEQTTSAEAAPSESTAAVTTPAPAQPKVKPSSWAALLQPASAAPSSAASAVPTRAPSVAFSSPAEAGPSRLPATPSAEPTTPKSTASALPPSSTGNRPAQTERPSFNYAAAAAAAAGLTPQEELAKIMGEGVKGKGKGVGVVPRGLINTGNMCFANTILQVLVYCTPFTDLLEELGKRLKADLGRKTPLLEAMMIFLREFTTGAAAAAPPAASGTSTPRSDAGKMREQRKDAFVPENVYDAMKENKRFDSMRRGHQEDAEEYLGFFLDTLHEELLYLISRTQSTRQINGGKPQTNGLPDGDSAERSIQRPVSPGASADDGDGWLEVGKKQKTNVVRATETRISAITRLFGGTIRSHLRTPGAKDSVTLEPYQPLQLDIQSPEITSITDALKHLGAPETVPGVWSASRGANVDATKQIYIESWPGVLMLHLKRFVYDSQARDVVKRSKPVAYEGELVVPQEIMSPGRKALVKYRLFGVVYHHGGSASGGHYTVAVQRQDQAGWIHFDDENVTTVPAEQVIVSAQEAEDARENGGRAGGLLVGGRERCAYLLFYQRVRA